MIRKLMNDNKWRMAIMIVTWLLLIWVRTFTGMTGLIPEIPVWGILGLSIVTIVCTFLLGLALIFSDDENDFFYENNEVSVEELYDPEDKEITEEDLEFMRRLVDIFYDKPNAQIQALRKSLLAVAILVVFFLFSFISAKWNGWIDLFNDSTYMEIGPFCFNKAHIFDVLMIVLFPLWTTFLIRKIAESRCAARVVILGTFQILMLTLLGFLLYMRLASIWLVKLAFINCLTLILAVKEYLWNQIDKKKNAIVMLIGYVLFWILLLSMLTHSGQTVAEFLGVENPSDLYSPGGYVSIVWTIMKEAAFVGQNFALLRIPYVTDFMMTNTNPIIGALFYGGWLAAILLVFVSIIFVITAWVTLIRSKRRDGRDVMLCMAWAVLVIRLVAGTLYSFGIPIYILPLFTGNFGIKMDSMCMTLLILGCTHDKVNRWVEGICEKYEEKNNNRDERIRRCSINNRILLVVVIILCLATFIIIWRFSLLYAISLIINMVCIM